MKFIICKAHQNAFCFGCDETSRENVEKNFFDCYEKQKKCETLKKYFENNPKDEF